MTAAIVGGATKYSALDTFRAFYRLEALRRKTEEIWKGMDVLLLPTAGTHYTHQQIAADPIQLNTNLGLYTNFVNLLDLCGVAVPAGFRSDGLPFGVTLLAPAFRDDAVCALGERFHQAQGGILGGTTTTLASIPTEAASPSTPAIPKGWVRLAVVGAHLTGQPLNHQLTQRGGILLQCTRSGPGYRLYALSGTVPPKPGLVRAPEVAGGGVELEVWGLPEKAFGSFVAEVPQPLAIGSVELEGGNVVKGFVCEPFALSAAHEITHFGGWRAYLGSLPANKAVRPPHATSPR
ncbi:MAG TPA: amidase family protein [Opitutaceae bacterium]|nr:amidase family protein [Opitutaceae bacterium]